MMRVGTVVIAAAGVAGLLLAGGAFAAAQAGPTAVGKVATATPAATPSTFTPIILSHVGEPLVVSGSDGLRHVDYDILVTNVFSAPLTLSAVNVRNEGGASVLSLTGDALAGVTEGNFIQQPVTPAAQIPVSGQVSVEIDVLVAEGTRLPHRLNHVISWSVPRDAHALALLDGVTTGQTSGLPLTVSRIRPEVITSPLRGAGWMSLNGCCHGPNAHRSLRVPVDGTREVKPEMFAVDWVQLKDSQFCTGQCDGNSDYPYFGTDELAVANGVVVKTRDGMPDVTPQAFVKRAEDYVGNSVVIRISPDRYAIYAHIERGTVAVKVGDRVRIGDVVGKLGNSGNSDAPHLHFVIADSPDAVTATSIPFVIDRWTLQGNAVLPPTEGPIPVNGPPSSQLRTHPLLLSVADFG